MSDYNSERVVIEPPLPQDLFDIQVALAELTADVEKNTTDIADNTLAISDNTTAIGNNETAISTNTSNISDNTTAIADNTTAISDNAANLQDHEASTTNVHGIQDTSLLATKEYVDSVPLNEKTASYTLSLSDVGAMVLMNVDTANTITVPTDASQNISIGSKISVLQSGIGQTDIVGDNGVTLNYTPGNKLRTQWSSAMLVKLNTNSWLLVGDLSP